MSVTTHIEAGQRRHITVERLVIMVDKCFGNFFGAHVWLYFSDLLWNPIRWMQSLILEITVCGRQQRQSHMQPKHRQREMAPTGRASHSALFVLRRRKHLVLYNYWSVPLRYNMSLKRRRPYFQTSRPFSLRIPCKPLPGVLACPALESKVRYCFL